MQQSESIATLAGALSKAQGAMQPAVKDRQNPHLKTMYATLTSVMDAVRAPLADNGLSVVQMLGTDEPGYLSVETRLIHSSGEWLSGVCRVRLAKDDAQGFGAAATYAKRYALSAMLCVVADDDDDGHAASQPGKSASRPPQTGGTGDLEKGRSAVRSLLAELEGAQIDTAPTLARFAGWDQDVSKARTLYGALKALKAA